MHKRKQSELGRILFRLEKEEIKETSNKLASTGCYLVTLFDV